MGHVEVDQCSRDSERRAIASPRVGISSCLLGELVRYDGGHKRADGLLSALSPHVEWVPICPEVEVGMGVPREPVDLVGDPSDPGAARMIAQSGHDWTDAMVALAGSVAHKLRRQAVRAYVFKANSPSCALGSAPLLDGHGVQHGTRDGLFAAELRRELPGLIVADERELSGLGARAAFLAALTSLRS